MDDILKTMGKAAFGSTRATAKRPSSPTVPAVTKRPAPPPNGPPQGHTAAEPAPVQPPQSTPERRQRIPALMVAHMADWPKHASAMAALVGGSLDATYRGDHYRIRTTTVDHFRKLQRYLAGRHLGFHTFTPRGGKTLKVVISGLPPTTAEELHDALTEARFAVEDVSPLRSYRGPTKSWIVALLPDGDREDPSTKKATAIYGLPSLLHVKVSVTTYRRPPGPPQCHRCQAFGHGSSNCFRPMKCVRCGEEHSRDDCRRPADAKGTCCNCGGEHNASYRGCSAFKAATAKAKASVGEESARRKKEAARPRRPTTRPTTVTVADLFNDEEADNSPVDEDPGPDPPGKKRKRKARNPANREKRAGTSTPRPAASSTQRPTQAPAGLASAEATSRPTPLPRTSATDSATVAEPAAQPSTTLDTAALLAELLRQLTALIGQISAVLPLLSRS